MASGRILKKHTPKSPLPEKIGTGKGGLCRGLTDSHKLRPLKYFLLLSFICLMVSACGTAGNARKSPIPPPNDSGKTGVSEKLKDTLEDNRSETDDVFAKDDDVPEYFLKESSSGGGKDIGNPYTGYRVQIISTRDVSVADSVAGAFRVWADKHIMGYFPKTYVTFDQPYYKVHIGNFQFQERAGKFTQLLKAAYPSAWVVHDQIEPNQVPKQEIKVVN